MALRFQWDSAKAKRNLKKHGVSFEEASTTFGDPLSRTIFDPDHSEGEDRFVHLGMTFTGKLVVIAHTERAGSIRIISARIASRREQKTYEDD